MIRLSLTKSELDDAELDVESFSDFQVHRSEITKENKPKKDDNQVVILLKRNGDKRSVEKPKQITSKEWNVFLKQCASNLI